MHSLGLYLGFLQITQHLFSNLGILSYYIGLYLAIKWVGRLDIALSPVNLIQWVESGHRQRGRLLGRLE